MALPAVGWGIGILVGVVSSMGKQAAKVVAFAGAVFLGLKWFGPWVVQKGVDFIYGAIVYLYPQAQQIDYTPLQSGLEIANLFFPVVEFLTLLVTYISIKFTVWFYKTVIHLL